MAQNAYTQGVPEVSPSTDGGASYQSGRGADVEAFGGGLAQGGEAFGHGALTAGKFFGKVAADDASNQFQDFSAKLLHGDPSKTVAGPDGQPMPDTGYMGLKGRAALDARPGVQTQIDAKIKELREGLQSPEQQQEFDNFSRRYRTGVVEKVGTHADGQASTWYSSVNTATAKLAMDHISNNFDKPQEVAAGAADLTASYVRNAQIKGGSPQEIRQAMNDAKRDALSAQLEAMAVDNPNRALSMLNMDENRKIAGVQYDNLANKLRSRADQQFGIGKASESIKKTYQTNPEKTLYTDVQLSTAGAPYGISGSYLSRVHALEGDGVSPTGAKGPFQFIDSTAKQFGVADPFNPDQAAAGAARLAAANRDALAQRLGRPPTDAELYLAHQQGGGGAAALIANPSMTAQQALMTLSKYQDDPAGAARAIRVNGGDPNAPAAAFTSMWTAKFNGAPGLAVAQRRASALQSVLSDPELAARPQAQAQAIAYVNQQMASQRIAMEEDASTKKAASDKIQSDFVTEIIRGGGPDIISRIASSPLGATEKENLYNFATGKGGIEDTLAYGRAYPDAMNRILLPADDPSKLYDVADVIRMRNDGLLTKKGADDIIKTMNEIKKNPDAAGVATTRASQLKYYQRMMGIDNEMSGMGMPAFKNPKGLNKYDHDFVPAVEAAYNAWAKKGGDPTEFWNDRKKLDGIMDSVYPPSERKKDSLFASGIAGPPVPAPPAPAGADKKAWDRFMKAPPNGTDGQPWPLDKWGQAIEILRADPSETRQKQFDQHFGPSGYTAKDVLSRLPPAPKPVSAAPGGADEFAAGEVKKAEGADDGGPTLLQRASIKFNAITAKEPNQSIPVAMGVRG